jgi:hypothetical protein
MESIYIAFALVEVLDLLVENLNLELCFLEFLFNTLKVVLTLLIED